MTPEHSSNHSEKGRLMLTKDRRGTEAKLVRRDRGEMLWIEIIGEFCVILVQEFFNTKGTDQDMRTCL
jgi:hypothetical protein